MAYFRQELNNYKAEINYLKPFPKNLKKELNDINNNFKILNQCNLIMLSFYQIKQITY